MGCIGSKYFSPYKRFKVITSKMASLYESTNNNNNNNNNNNSEPNSDEFWYDKNEFYSENGLVKGRKKDSKSH